jgi:hypothetical protein
VDKDWWWPEDVKKLAVAAGEWTRKWWKQAGRKGSNLQLKAMRGDGTALASIEWIA